MDRLRRLVERISLGPSPANYRKVMMAYAQSVPMAGLGLWWNGDHTQGTNERPSRLQLDRKPARSLAASGQPTGVHNRWSRGSGQQPPSYVENRQRRFGLQLLVLPQSDQTKDIVGAAWYQQTTRVRTWVLRRRQSAPGLGSPHSRTGYGWTAELPDTYADRMAERPALGRHQNPHGLQPGSLRGGVRRPRQRIGNRCKVTDETGQGHNLHRCPGCHQAHGLGGK